MLLCCLRRNVDWLFVINTSSSSSVKNKRRRLPASSVNNLDLPRYVPAQCSALGSRTVHSTRWNQILAQNRLPTCIRCPRYKGGPRRNIAMTFGMEKLMVWLPDGEKIEDVFILFDRIHERDGQTGRWTNRQTDIA